MITNQLQYRVTKSTIEKFREAIRVAEASEPSEGVAPEFHQAAIDAYHSEIEALQSELDHYDDLRSGRIGSRQLGSLCEVPIALIEARIVAGISQKELGRRLGVAEQQIQRYEKNHYSGADLDRLQATADALGVDLVEHATYHPQETESVGKARARKVNRRSRYPRLEAVKGEAKMADKRTSAKGASAAGKTLGSPTASKAAKRAAASDLAQRKTNDQTGAAAASAAGKTLGSKGASKAAKSAAASDLSQRSKAKKNS